MNKSLHKYVNEIIDLGTAANKGWNEGVNKFLSNVKNHGKDDLPHYGGADQLDWNAVAAELTPFTDADEADMINAFNADYTAHMDDVIAAREAGDYDKAVEIMVNA